MGTNNLLKKILRKKLIESYQGSHTAPSKEDSPMFNLSDTYPEDIYSADAPRLYGDNGGNGLDRECIGIIQAAHNKPNHPVKIYRAVPDDNKEIEKELKKISNIISHFDKFRFFPKNEIVNAISSKYYKEGEGYILPYDEMQEQVLRELREKYSDLTSKKVPKLTINSGDWVTISKEYAKEHGESNLRNNFKILSKIVPAMYLFTDGNSLYEWGYTQ